MPKPPKNRRKAQRLALAKLILAWQDVRKMNANENRFSHILIE
jgi:hypothetical protein